MVDEAGADVPKTMETAFKILEPKPYDTDERLHREKIVNQLWEAMSKPFLLKDTEVGKEK